MTLDELLPTLTAYGVQVWLEGGEVRISVPSRLPERVLSNTLVPAIRANHDSLVQLLRGEDSVVRMRADGTGRHERASPQPTFGPKEAGMVVNQCLSCGDELSPGHTYRCITCVHAAWLMTQNIPSATWHNR